MLDPMLMLQSPSMGPPSPSDSHSVSYLHSLQLSVLLIFLILIVALLITLSIYFLLRRLRTRCLISPSSGDCAICLSPFQPEDHLRHLPLCCHAFHADCISIWLVSNQNCPLCRSPLLATSEDATTATAASLAADVGHDGSRRFLRDLSRGVSSRALSFTGSGRYFIGSSRRTVVGLEAGEEISEYFRWLSPV